jgi:GTPase
VQHLIRKRADDKDFMEIRVAVVGNVDAGKSTLLGKSFLKSTLLGKFILR